MFNHKSTQLSNRSNLHTLELHLGSDKAFHPHRSRLFPQRPSRALRTPPTQQNNNKKMQIMQTMDFLQTDQKPQPPRRLICSKASSYLAYKQQQFTLQTQHKQFYLKPKSRHQQQRGEINKSKHSSIGSGHNHSRSLSNPFEELSPKRKMNKIELTLNQNATQTEFHNCSPTRQFYIKTAEGKRQHLTARDYEIRVRSRARSQPTPPLGFTLNEYTDTPFFCTVSEVTVVPRSSHYRKAVVRKQSTGHLCRGTVAVEPPPLQEISCRPWTSARSEGER